MFDLTDKRVLITGGAHGLGMAVARRLAGQGSHLVIHYHSSDNRTVLREPEQLMDLGAAQVDLVQADFLRLGSIDRLFDDLAATLGGLDLLVNNAGVFLRRSMADTEWEDWARVFAVNTFAPAQCIRQAVKLGCQRVVNVADIVWNMSWENHAAYAASKAALVSLTRVAAVEYAPEVRINAVAPGLITVPEGMEELYDQVVARIPAGRTGMSEEVATAVEMLLTSPDYVTGQVVAVDGGLSLR